MSDYNDTEIARVDVSTRKPTGLTAHTRGGKKVPDARMLKMIRLAGDVSIYLIHYGENEVELTDTCHSTIDEALAQAQHEYGLNREDWSFASEQ